jgi:hypothetical protein
MQALDRGEVLAAAFIHSLSLPGQEVASHLDASRVMEDGPGSGQLGLLGIDREQLLLVIGSLGQFRPLQGLQGGRGGPEFAGRAGSGISS